MIVSIVFGLIAAALFAVAGALQHSVTRPLAAQRAGVGLLPVLGVLRGLLLSPVWLAGLLANMVAFVFHAAALHLGSIAIVQALLAVQLMLALPIAAYRTGRPPSVRDWLGTLAICVGLAALVLLRGEVPQSVDRRELVPLVVLCGFAFIALLLAAGRITAAQESPEMPAAQESASGQASPKSAALSRVAKGSRTALAGIAAGTGFSLTAVFTVVVTDQLAREGWRATVADWPAIGLLGCGLVAAILAQQAFASGSLPTALTAMTVADPLLSWVWGGVLFDRSPPTSLPVLAGMTFSGVLIAAGVAVLANSSSVVDIRSRA